MFGRGSETRELDGNLGINEMLMEEISRGKIKHRNGCPILSYHPDHSIYSASSSGWGVSGEYVAKATGFR